MVNELYERKLLSSSTLLIEEPNNRIYKFDGRLELSESSGGKNAAHLSQRSSNAALRGNIEREDQELADPSWTPLNNSNVALRGMSLRNTEHVTGVVVYTGHETKI